MRQFAELVMKLGSSTKTNDKLEALMHYFTIADNKDKVWVIAIFSGRRPKRAVNTTQLAGYCIELSGIPFWRLRQLRWALWFSRPATRLLGRRSRRRSPIPWATR